MSKSRLSWAVLLVVCLVTASINRADDPCGDGRKPQGSAPCMPFPAGDEYVKSCYLQDANNKCQGKTQFVDYSKTYFECSIPGMDVNKGFCVNEYIGLFPFVAIPIQQPCATTSRCIWYGAGLNYCLADDPVAVGWYQRKIKLYLCGDVPAPPNPE